MPPDHTTATSSPTDDDLAGDTEYRIEFTIQRQQPGDGDFTEIGFGSSGGWSTVDQAAHILESGVQNREWETEPGQPDPRSIP